jgi:hypothetical protein
MRIVATLVLASLASACARTPPVTTHYYLTKTAFHTKVIRTVACDGLDRPVVASSATTEAIHSADTSKPEKFELWRIDGALANSELKTEFTGDGRMKSINTSTTGQGETVLKTAIKIAEIAAETNRNEAEVKAKCQDLKLAFKDKPLTLIFESWDDLTLNRDVISIPPESQSDYYYNWYRPIVGDTCLRLGRAASARLPVTYPAESGDAILWAQQPGILEVAVAIGPAGGCGASNLWSGTVQVAQLGQRYGLPIPRAALFGKQVFGATFDDAGGLTMLQYNKESGAGPMLATIQAGAEALQTTDAERAAALKSEADVIAAQQRLVRCRTNSTGC